MRFRFALTCVAVAMMCSSAVWAQPGGGRPGGGRGPGGGGASLLGLLGIEAIQKELELTDDQVAAIKKLQEEMGGGRGGFGPGGRGGPGAPGGRRPGGQDGDRGRGGDGQGGEGGRRPQRPQSNEEARNSLDGTFFIQQEQPRRNFQDLSEEERQKLIEERQKEAAERAKQEKEKLGEILLPHQMKRLQEIALQIQGTRALEDPEVVKALDISEAQQKDLTAAREKAREESSAQMRELFQGGGENRDFNAIREKMTELRKKSDEKVLALLNADQKKKFEDMKGKPFEMPEGGLRPGGFGGPGGGAPGGQGGRRPGGQGGQGGGQRPARPDA